MALTRRETELFLYLLNESKPVKGFKIAEHFNVTERTVHNDIKDLNDFLSAFSITVSADKNKGYWISDESRIVIQSEHIVKTMAEGMDFELPQNSNERVVYLLYNMCFGNEYSLEDIEDLLFVSRSAAINDVKTLESLLKSKLFISLSMKKNKYFIDAPESRIRSAISGIYTRRYNDILELKYSHFITGDESFWNVIYYLSSLIGNFCREMNFQLTGDSIYSFSVDIALTYHRVVQGYTIEKQDRPISFTGMKLKLLLVENDDVFSCLSDDDYVYLERRLFAKDYLHNDPISVSEEIRNTYSQFVSLLSRFGFRIIGNITIVQQQIQKLVLRYRYGYYFNIPEKREICSDNPVFYYFAHVLKYFVEKNNKDIRIGLSGVSILTMILKQIIVFPKKTAILVTDCDPWLAQDIRQKLLVEFRDELELSDVLSRYDYDSNETNEDLVITTEPLRHKPDIVSIPVHRILEKSDIDRIREELAKEENRETDLQFIEEASSYESGILSLLKRLYREKQIGCLDFDYIESHLYNCLICKDCDESLLIACPLVSSHRMKKYQISLKEPYEYMGKQFFHIEFCSFPITDTARIRASFHRFPNA